MSFSIFNERTRCYDFFFPSRMSSVNQTVYMTKMIRAGFEAADVNMWQALLQQAKTNIGESHTFVFLLLDMARHNKCDVLEIIKTGRVCSEQKAVNDKFMHALMNCVNDETDNTVHVEATVGGKQVTGVLDLTCDEELSESDSHSYEETSEEYNANPTSAEAYELDGFVVEDHHSDPDEDNDDGADALKRFGGASVHLKKPRKLKRRLETIAEEE